MATKTEAKEHIEHLMEAFPMPQGMPSEWHEHDVAAAKLKIAEKAKAPVVEVAKAEVKTVTDAEKEAHLMEKFPKPRSEPDNWHCTHCDK